MIRSKKITITCSDPSDYVWAINTVSKELSFKKDINFRDAITINGSGAWANEEKTKAWDKVLKFWGDSEELFIDVTEILVDV